MKNMKKKHITKIVDNWNNELNMISSLAKLANEYFLPKFMKSSYNGYVDGLKQSKVVLENLSCEYTSTEFIISYDIKKYRSLVKKWQKKYKKLLTSNSDFKVGKGYALKKCSKDLLKKCK